MKRISDEVIFKTKSKATKAKGHEHTLVHTPEFRKPRNHDNARYPEASFEKTELAKTMTECKLRPKAQFANYLAIARPDSPNQKTVHWP